jgi:hypothetical protein
MHDVGLVKGDEGRIRDYTEVDGKEDGVSKEIRKIAYMVQM